MTANAKSDLSQAWANFRSQLGDNFLEIMDWSIAEKVTFMCVVLLFYHGIIFILWEFSYSRNDLTISYFSWRDFQLLWIAVIVAAFACVLLLRKQKLTWQWPYLLMSCIYIGFTVVNMQALGTMASYPAAHLGCALVVILVFLGGRIVLASSLFAVCLLVLVLIAETRQIIPYAPFILQRNLDALNTPAFGMAAFSALFVIILQGLTITFLVLSALKNSEQKLIEASTIIRRYVPSAVADDVLAGRHADIETPQRRRVTVLFADIVGFTDVADRVEPEITTQVLSEYLSAMTATIESHQGTLNEFAGDGVMALFGAPVALAAEDQALQAVKAAKQMQRSMADLNQQWRKLGLGQELQIRIGINTGILSVGSYGSLGRSTYTAIGLQTNVTDRIQSHCQPGQILISEASWELIRNEIACAAQGEIAIKGVHFPVRVFKPIISSQSE